MKLKRKLQKIKTIGFIHTPTPIPDNDQSSDEENTNRADESFDIKGNGGKLFALSKEKVKPL